MQANLRKKVSWALAVSAGLGAYAGAKADITSFTAGDIVVLRAGDGSAGGLSGNTAAAFLDEYTPTGGLVGSITLPTSSSGSVNALSLDVASDTNHEGLLSLSQNGQWLAFGGYNNAPGTNTGGPNVSNVTIAEISQNASTLNTSTSQATGTIRAATTFDGNEFYTGSKGQTNGGVEYFSSVGGTPTVINANFDTRAVAVLNGTNVVTGTGSSSYPSGHGIYELGSSSTTPTTTLPTGNTTSASLIINNATDGTDFVFAKLAGGNGNYDGYNVIYAVGGPAGSQVVSKYAYNFGTTNSEFNLVTSVAPNGPTAGSDTLDGVTVSVDGQGNANLYFTDLNGLWELTDGTESAFGSPTWTPASETEIAPNPANEELLGVALAPTAVPEPTTLGLLAVGSIGLLARRRRKA